MIGEWCYFKSYLSKQTCEDIINAAEPIQYQDGLVGTGTGIGQDLDYRRSKIKFLSSTDWRFSGLFDDLWKTAIKANNDFFNVQISKLDFVQLAEYDSSYKGEYKEHHDVFWVNGDPFYHRKLSCVIQLTDPRAYTGGDLEIVEAGTKPNADDIRQQGSIIFFPSVIKHKANQVLTGTRYSIAAWFDGPKWR